MGKASFRGTHSISLDSKGRVTMPKKYYSIFSELNNDEYSGGIAINQTDELLSGKSSDDRIEKSDITLVLTIDIYEKCLVLYSFDEWLEIENKIMGLPNLTPIAKRLQRLVVGHADEVTLDGQGRILIPSMLREHAKLDKKIVLLGQSNKLELWSAELFAQGKEQWIREASEEKSGQMSDEQAQQQIANLSL